MYIHLTTHSAYSLLEGLPLPAELAQAARDSGMSALGLTEHRTLTGSIEFAATSCVRLCSQRHPVTGCLHPKSAVMQASPDTLLINPAWVDKKHFPGWKFVEVHPDEPSAANIVLVPGGAIFPSHFPKTQKRLEEAGIRLTIVPASEVVAKAGSVVTCCALIFSA